MFKRVKGAIAAGNHLTAAAGRDLFSMGGNAFDAIVGAALTAFVTESTLSSAGGGGFLLARTGEGESSLFDFFCQTPRYKKPVNEIHFYPVAIDFGGAVQEFHIGKGSIAPPGALKGLWQVQKRYGRLPFSVVAEPAIAHAREGFRYTAFNEFCARLLRSILFEDKEALKVYAPRGELLRSGESCYMKDFADALSYLVETGMEDFYKGEIARKIDRDLRDGGYTTLEDLNDYRVLVRNPLKVNYRGYEILTNPPPSSGGILIAFALKLLDDINLSHAEFLSEEHLRNLILAMKLTNQARAEKYDNYIHNEEIIEEFLNIENLNTYQNKWGSTTHISTIDDEGNAASATFSNGEGSAYTIPNTGIMMNNMLGEADLNPGGFHGWPVDRRMSSMMAPTIVLEGGKPKFVLGSGGSNRIRTAILQVISNLIDFRQPLDRAISNPRVHWENGELNIEPFAGREELTLAGAGKIFLWEKKNMFFGGVHGVGIDPSGYFVATGDPRRDGVGLVMSDR